MQGTLPLILSFLSIVSKIDESMDTTDGDSQQADQGSDVLIAENGRCTSAIEVTLTDGQAVVKGTTTGLTDEEVAKVLFTIA